MFGSRSVGLHLKNRGASLIAGIGSSTPRDPGEEKRIEKRMDRWAAPINRKSVPISFILGERDRRISWKKKRSGAPISNPLQSRTFGASQRLPQTFLGVSARFKKKKNLYSTNHITIDSKQNEQVMTTCTEYVERNRKKRQGIWKQTFQIKSICRQSLNRFLVFGVQNRV